MGGGRVSLPNVFPRPRPGVKFAELVQLLFQRLLRVKITKNPSGRGKNRLPPNGFVGLSFRRAKGGRALVKTPPPPPFPPAHNGQVGADNAVWLSFAILTEGARSPPFYNICFLRGRQPPCESARLWVGFSFALTLGMSRLATSLSGALGQGLCSAPLRPPRKSSLSPRCKRYFRSGEPVHKCGAIGLEPLFGRTNQPALARPPARSSLSRRGGSGEKGAR